MTLPNDPGVLLAPTEALSSQPKSNRCPDGRCDGTGFLFDDAKRTAYPCSCRPRRVARRKAQKIAGVIPRRYRGVSFDRPPVTEMNPHVVRAVRAYVDTVEDNLTKGQGLWFHGDLGTGKTTLAMLVSSQALNLGHSVAIYSLPRLLGILRQTFDEGADTSLTELLDRLGAVELLHIDDVGAEQTSAWVLEQLYTIINTRYEEKRSVLITTNLDIGKLREQIGERTVSRLVEMCGDPLPLHGRDLRWDSGIMLPKESQPEPIASR